MSMCPYCYATMQPEDVRCPSCRKINLHKKWTKKDDKEFVERITK